MTTCREQWWQPRGDLPGPAAGDSEPPPPWLHSELRGSLPSIHPAYPPSLKPADKQDLSKIICGKDCNYNFQHITHLSNIYGKDCTYSFNISMYITFDNFEVNQSCTLAAQWPSCQGIEYVIEGEVFSSSFSSRDHVPENLFYHACSSILAI